MLDAPALNEGVGKVADWLSAMETETDAPVPVRLTVLPLALAVTGRPAHRDKTAMNGPQLLMAQHGSSGLMTGPPAGYLFPTDDLQLTPGNGAVRSTMLSVKLASCPACLIADKR